MKVPLGRFVDRQEWFRVLPSTLTLLLAGASVLSYPRDLHGQTVQGHLNDGRTGFAMIGANVALRDSSGTVVARTDTDYLGGFRITTPDPGRYSLLAEAIGYRSTESESFWVILGQVTTVDLSLPPEPVELDSLNVEAERQRVIPHLERSGFYQRMEEGFGQFITPDEIEERHPRYFGDLLRDVPGLRVDVAGGMRWPPRCRGLTSQVWLDGIRTDPSKPLSQVVSIDEIEAVEIYIGAARVPLQWGGLDGQCTMLIWTKL